MENINGEMYSIPDITLRNPILPAKQGLGKRTKELWYGDENRHGGIRNLLLLGRGNKDTYVDSYGRTIMQDKGPNEFSRISNGKTYSVQDSKRIVYDGSPKSIVEHIRVAKDAYGGVHEYHVIYENDRPSMDANGGANKESIEPDLNGAVRFLEVTRDAKNPNSFDVVEYDFGMIEYMPDSMPKLTCDLLVSTKKVKDDKVVIKKEDFYQKSLNEGTTEYEIVYEEEEQDVSSSIKGTDAELEKKLVTKKSFTKNSNRKRQKIEENNIIIDEPVNPDIVHDELEIKVLDGRKKLIADGKRKETIEYTGDEITNKNIQEASGLLGIVSKNEIESPVVRLADTMIFITAKAAQLIRTPEIKEELSQGVSIERGIPNISEPRAFCNFDTPVQDMKDKIKAFLGKFAYQCEKVAFTKDERKQADKPQAITQENEIAGQTEKKPAAIGGNGPTEIGF